MILVPQSLFRAEPRGNQRLLILSMGGISIPGDRERLPGGGVLSRCTSTPGPGEMPEQGLCQPKCGSKRDLAPLKAPQHDSSKLCALLHVPLQLFSHVLCHFSWAGAPTLNHPLLLHPSQPHPGCKVGGLQAESITYSVLGAPHQSSGSLWVFSQ